ncbi:MAG: Bug family tripartite tricarboxylate transporter substrate binding protein [Burkholderiales bacterium]
MKFQRLLQLILVVLMVAPPALAQVAGYPAKPVRMVIPYPPGGAVDALARAVANDLGKAWGQPVVIESKPGAGGVAGAVAVANSAADGYTIFFTDQTPLTITPFLQRDLPYDPQKDFAAVVTVIESSSMVVVPAKFPVNSIAELIAAAKAKPGALNFGSWGLGSTAHLDPEEFALIAKVNMTHVPFKGAADMFRSLLSGEIQLAFISLGAALPQIKQGAFKPLGYGAIKRTPLLPDVPTVAESGLPGFDERSWLGILAPGATPRPLINKIAADTARVLAVPAFKEKFIDSLGFEASSLPPDTFAKLIDETRAKRQAQLLRLKLQVN